MAPSGMGVFGCGIKFKKPLSPKTTNISPIKTLTMVGIWREKGLAADFPAAASVEVWFAFICCFFSWFNHAQDWADRCLCQSAARHRPHNQQGFSATGYSLGQFCLRRL